MNDPKFGHQITPESIEHKVLQIVQKTPTNTVDLFAQLGKAVRLLSAADLVSTVCTNLHAAKALTYDDGRWGLGSDGFTLLNFLNQKAEATPLQAPTRATQPKSYKPPPGNYSGEELLVTCMRKGAYDFLAKPSRMGDDYITHHTAHLAEA